MAYTLYGARGSGSAIIESALSLIGAPHTVEHVSLRQRAQRSADYTAINPHGKLPALCAPDGQVWTESVAILLCLDERHPAAGLLPPPASPERAVALRWLLFMATELYPLVEIDDYPARFAPDATAGPAMKAVAAEHYRRRLLLVEQAIAGDPWLQAGGMSIVDVYLALISRWVLGPDWRSANTPKVEAVFAAVLQHPVVGVVFARHAPPAGA